MTARVHITRLYPLAHLYLRPPACPQGENGQLCGGYSDVPWVQSGNKGRYIHSDEAFLFTLVNHQNVPPTKFPVKKRMYAICYHPQ